MAVINNLKYSAISGTAIRVLDDRGELLTKCPPTEAYSFRVVWHEVHFRSSQS
jgi:hypothetical protein